MERKYPDLLERFFTYVKMDTKSDEKNEETPSTEKQKRLGELLVQELKGLGVKEALMDEHGYVYGRFPGNGAGKIKVGLIAHLDTSPAVSGEGVKRQLIRYGGGDVVLPGDTSVIIPEDEKLRAFIGKEIVTTDGTTLLGADDKAGIAAILTLLNYLGKNPSLPRPEIRIAFTPDEEIGKGTVKFDLKRFGAEAAYTVDGGEEGEIEDENFNADSYTAIFRGINVHPGQAKGKMVNSLKAAALFLSLLPRNALSPETTEKREGFVHPTEINGNEEKTVVHFILRDFEESGLLEKKRLLDELGGRAAAEFPGSSFEGVVNPSYRNMKVMIDKRPEVLELALKAIEEAGVKPLRRPIRGGTDGAKLSFLGIPTPNLFTGAHNMHSKREWIGVESLEKSVDVLVNLMRLWAEKDNGR